MKEADELLSKGDVVQASEKYYKVAEEAIKILSYRNSIKTISKANQIGHWNSRLYFDAIDELENIYSDIRSLWKSAWILHIEGFHEARLQKEVVEVLKKDIEKLIKLI
ncbi:PaREP1 family protein [Stygiolobus azoricus]|uniref:HEPN domain-containing protein n=1 Tax=Stygiolobus azoricus TaxID=41675 RepID=A0A650CRV4_9CREN|nr:PaREP1 family protein [Stygiolobus azoricus]QGR20528.1 hypothetical protein D1868_06850 [Stygiolobus azoricus]